MPKYFLYSDRIQLNSDNDDIAQLGTLRFPTPLTKTDKQGRTFKVYRNQLTLPVGVLGITPGETIVNLRFQGCADDGFCYPPEVRQIKLAISDKLALSQVDLETLKAPEEVTPEKTEQSEQDIADIFANHNWIMILLIFYGFGLLLSFTPCILPMVPVLSGIIVGHGKTATTKKHFSCH